MIGGIVVGLPFAIAVGIVLSLRPRLATVAVRVGLALVAVLISSVLLSGNPERIGFFIPVLAVLLLPSPRRKTAPT